jgi:hypothetical protein
MPAPLLPNTDFSTVDYFTGDMAYCIANPVFDGLTQFLGHLPKLGDESLDPNGVLSRVSAVVEPFRVVKVSGSIVSWASGVVRGTDGRILSVVGGQVSLPADSVSYIFIDSVATVQVVSDVTEPDAYAKMSTIRLVLARVTTVGTNVTTIEDYRSLATRRVDVPTNIIKVYGGQSRIDRVVTQNEVIDEALVYCRNFTVPAGITCTITNNTKILCSGNFTCNGTITMTPCILGGAGYIAGGSGSCGGFPGGGIGAGSGGGAGLSGRAYSWLAQPYGSGGSAGFGYASPTSSNLHLVPNGGEGGSGLWVEAQKVIVNGGVINCNGNSASTPPGSTAFNYCGGSGGSGGTVVLSAIYSVFISNTSSIFCRGGNGVPGNKPDTTIFGGFPGGGGAGGQIVLMSPSINYSGANLNVLAGTVGANVANQNGIVTRGGGNGGTGGTHTTAATNGVIRTYENIPLY